jgi:DNA-binding NarL/FixJ family response regulator
MCPVSLLIADDHDIIRRGLRALLQEHPGWDIAAEVKDGREAVAKASDLKPDVAILDISMPSLNGLDAAKQIARPTAHVVNYQSGRYYRNLLMRI